MEKKGVSLCSNLRIRRVHCLGHAHVGCVNATGFVFHGCC